MTYSILKKNFFVSLLLQKDGRMGEVTLHVDLSWIIVAINIACWEWHLGSAYQPTPSLASSVDVRLLQRRVTPCTEGDKDHSPELTYVARHWKQ
jgi:hypothetical protein